MSVLHTWTTREGQVIPVRELEDKHLLSIVAMLDRNAQRVYNRLCEVSKSFKPSRNSLAIQSGGPDQFLPHIYWVLIKEAARRSLATRRLDNDLAHS